jgi:hypothetical protein
MAINRCSIVDGFSMFWANNTVDVKINKHKVLKNVFLIRGIDFLQN